VKFKMNKILKDILTRLGILKKERVGTVGFTLERMEVAKSVLPRIVVGQVVEKTAFLEELKNNNMPTGLATKTLEDNDIIPGNKLYIYPYNDGEKIEQRILYGYGRLDITSNYHILAHFISVSHGDIIAKSVHARPGGLSSLGKIFGNKNYDIRGLKRLRYGLGLSDEEVKESYTVKELKEMERKLNANSYDEKRVLELSDVKMVRDGKFELRFEEENIVTVTIAGDFFDIMRSFERFSKMSGNTYNLVQPITKKKIEIIITPDSDNTANFNDLVNQQDKIWKSAEWRQHQAQNPKTKKEESHRRELTEEEKLAIELRRREISGIYEARKGRLSAQTAGRMFTAIDPSRWVRAINVCSDDREAQDYFEVTRKWGILMEDAMQKGYTLEQCAVPFLEDLTICKYSNVYGDRNFYASQLYGFSSLLAPYWVHGEQLKEYINGLSSTAETPQVLSNHKK